MKRIFFIYCFFSILFFACTVQGVEDSVRLEEPELTDSTAFYDSLYAPAQFTLDTFFRNRQINKLFNGNVLIADKGKIVLHKSYGLQNPNGKDSLGLNDLFQLASVSKPFTSAAVLLLYDRGVLNLDDTITKYIDSFPYPGITIHHLLCHRAGLCNYTYFCDEKRNDRSTPVNNDEVIALMKKCNPKPYYHPDQKFDYSNTGFMLLASIVEKASGKKFEDFMKEEIFDPLGMKNSFIYNTKNAKDGMLDGYDFKGRKIEDSYLNGAVGDKGMYSTVYDIYLFDEAIRKGNLLKKKTWDLAFKPRNEERPEKGKDDYGYGWRLKTSFAGYDVVYHTGWWKGFRSYFIRNRTLDQTIIILDNYKCNRFFSIEELLDVVAGIRRNI